MNEAQTWLNEHFTDNSVLICAAFRADNSMWNSEDEKLYALLYIGAIDPDLKTYIEDYYCSDDITLGISILTIFMWSFLFFF